MPKKTNPTLSIQQSDLSAALSKAMKFVARRTTLPILDHVKLVGESDVLTLSATNLEIGIVMRVPTTCTGQFAAALNARTLNEVVNNLPNAPVTLSVSPKTQTTTLKGDRFTNNIKGLDPEEFPLAPVAKTAIASINSKTLKQLIGRVAFAAARDESRPILTGVSMELSGKRLTMAAADGFRLSVESVDLDQEVDCEPVIEPARALLELSRLLGDDDEVQIGLNDTGSAVIFELPGMVVYSQVIDGKFPEYRPIIPKRSDTTIEVDRTDLLTAAKAIKVFAREDRYAIVVRAKEAASIQVESPDTMSGQSNGTLDAVVAGQTISVAMNVNYLIDALNALTGDRVTFNLTNNKAPILLSEGTFQHVVMPMMFLEDEEPKQIDQDGNAQEPTDYDPDEEKSEDEDEG
jgi:DNA polymerase-3 subunit beta